jgi:predicted nucleic acid-binding Zn finger protein
MPDEKKLLGLSIGILKRLYCTCSHLDYHTDKGRYRKHHIINSKKVHGEGEFFYCNVSRDTRN